MENVKVRAETENIKLVMKDMITKMDEIEEMLKNTRIKIEESKKVFDTPTSSYFRQKVYDYIDSQKLYINNDFRPLIDVLGVIADAYEEELEEETKIISVNTRNTNKVKTEAKNG